MPSADDAASLLQHPSRPPDIIEGEYQTLAVTRSPAPATRPPFKITASRRRAAALIAAGDLTLREIAKKVGYSENTLMTYKKHPVFAELVARYEAEADERMTTLTVTRKRKRLELIQDLLDDALDFRLQRGRQFKREHHDVPGGETGMVALRYKIVRMGADTEVIKEYLWDRPLQDAMVSLFKAADEQTGHTAAETDSGIRRVYIGIDIDKV